MPVSWSLGELAERTRAELHGDAACVVHRVGMLQDGGEGTLAFLADPRFRDQLPRTRVSAVVLHRADLPGCPTNALVSADPYLTFARVARLLNPLAPAQPGVHPSASIAADAIVDSTAQVGPQVVIEDAAQVGSGAIVGPGCVIGRGARLGCEARLVAAVIVGSGCLVGERTLIHPGAVIGSDGFGFVDDGKTWEKVPQLGSVVIGDDVEIGANTTIDRGTLGDTVIECGVKIDNLVQVGHNVRIGADTVISGCVGIAGSARIGSHCALGGAVSVSDHVTLTDEVRVTFMSTVTRSIDEPGVYSSGTPLQPSRGWRRSSARFKQLDDMAKRITRLEKRERRRAPESD